MEVSRGLPRLYRFGPFELDVKGGVVRREGLRVKLHDQPLRVLTLLVERAGEVVSRDELRRVLWEEDTFVDFDHGVNTAVNKLRQALGDSAARPRYVETVPRRGYRFVAPVEVTAARRTRSGRGRARWLMAGLGRVLHRALDRAFERW